MEKIRLRDRKGAIYLSAFLLPFVMMQIFWAINGIYPYGDNSILTGDMDLEFVNFYSYFINTLKTGNDWSYMFAKTLGGDFPGLAAFQLHDPLLLILLLFPGEKIAAGIELVFTLQVSIAGLSASVLLNSRYRKSWLSLLFSTAYAFSGFFFGYLVLTIYFGCLAVLPLVIYFFLKYLENKRYLVPYVLITAYYIFVNYHMGFMLVIFITLLYVSRIIEDKNNFKKLGSFIISGITILLIDGFFLIRTGLSLLGEKTTEGADYGLYRRFPMNQLFAGLFTGCARNDLMPLIYCSVTAVFFALIYFMSRKYSIREKLANLFLLASVAVSMWINALDAVWHGFNNPEGFYWRYAFLISIIMAALGYKACTELVYGSAPDKNKIILSFAAAGMMLAYMIWLMISGNTYLDTIRFIINAFLTAAILMTAITAVKYVKVRNYVFVLLLLISAADMLYNSKTAYISLNSSGGELPKMSAFREDYSSINDVISYVKREDGGFYRIEKDFDRAVNDPALFDYIGMSHDSSCEKDEIIDWLNNFGFCRTVYYTYYNGGGTSFTDAFFGIKYYISRFDETFKPYIRLPYEGKYHAYLNEYALPLAYAAPNGLKDYSFDDGNTFLKQNRLASYWGSEKEIYKKAEFSETLQGAAETGPSDAGEQTEATGKKYKRISDDGFIIYNIRITENLPLYLYFSAPHRQGAELFINGEQRDLYFTENHWNVLYAGTYGKEENVEIRLKLLDDELEVTEACFYYEDREALSEWHERAAALNEGLGEINRLTSSHLKFDATAGSNKRIVMSIPYDKGWRVTCDGVKLNTEPAMQVLLSYEIPSGAHAIEMKYTPHGTAAGLIASCAGLIMFAVLCFKTYRKQDALIR